MKNRPLIGVGIIIVKNNCILLGKRINAHGQGTWAPPGGHLEYGETPEQCAMRELDEETGIKITNLRRAPFTSDVFEEKQKHYITLFFIADYFSGIPINREPEKCEGWHWISILDFPTNIFAPFQTLIKEYNLEQLILESVSNTLTCKPKTYSDTI